MAKSILITGATDGIGRAAALKLSKAGHTLLVHGRSQEKLEAVLAELGDGATGYLADLGDLEQVREMAAVVREAQPSLDVLINNAGVLKVPRTTAESGLDVRFVVNTLAPVLLCEHLLPIIPDDGRVLNLSSAAQSPVALSALRGLEHLPDMEAYAQSKLALTMLTRQMAQERPSGPVFIAINPGSLLATNMVRDGFGVAGNDLSIRADILCRAALDDEFADASGQYFDNDAGRFGPPHPDALDAHKAAEVSAAVAELLEAQSV